MRQLVVASLLVAGMAGCALLDFSGSWYAGADHLACGPWVEWGAQTPDEAGACGVVASCPDGADGARVEFTGDLVACCLVAEPIAGCFVPTMDWICLSPADRIEDTALRHELTHRALWLQGRDLDYGHAGPEWTR